MKRNILLLIMMCISISVAAQKTPKKTFSSESHPYSGGKWQVGESINLSDDSSPQGVVYTATDLGEQTFFMGRGACRSEEGHWLAIYPASSLHMWNMSSLHFVIPNEQVANSQTNPMYSRTEGRVLDFRPLTAYLKFDIPSDLPPIKEIRISANKYISGNYMADFSTKTVSVKLDTGDRFRDIVLKAEEGGLLLPGEYTMAIFARVLPDGLVMEVVAEDGKVAVKKITGQLKFTLGKTRDIGVLHNLKFIDRNSPSLVGTKYGDQGIVFWTDPSNPSVGKVVSATAKVIPWSSKNELYGIHGDKENYEKTHSTVTSLPAYKSNPAMFSAVYYCDQMRKEYGGNWHVPSVSEMKYLFNTYYGQDGNMLPENGAEYTDAASMDAAAFFDEQIEALGGERMLSSSSEYWICGQNSNGNMQYVNMRKFYNGHSPQTTERYVRCVRDFDSSRSDIIGTYPKTEIGKLLKSELCPKIVEVLWDTTYNVTNGLDFYQMSVITDTYEKQDIYLLRTDPSKGLDLKVAISDETTASSWKRQTPAKMATHADIPSNPLYAIINADFCDNREPIKPRGPVHSGGKIWASTYSIDPKFTQQALSYVGVTFDGKMTIASSADYPLAKKSLRECTGAGVILIKDSKIQGGFVDLLERDPRTAIGYTSDNIVWMLAVDGRHETSGMTYGEMASIFYTLGCVDAVNLDGGGSTQMLIKDPKTGKMKMCNWPSDPNNGFGGRERPRLNAWTVIKK